MKKDSRPYSQKHPRFYLILGWILLLAIICSICFCVYYLGKGFLRLIQYASTLDTIIIVALVTGALSLISVTVSKVFEYKQNKRQYLYQKREKPYASFIELIYKIQDKTHLNEKNNQEELIKDLSSVSKDFSIMGIEPGD